MKLRPRSTRVKAPANNCPAPQASTPSTVNDVVSPNPQGRDATDCRKVKGFLTCKAHRQVGTLNTRTLSEEYKRKELANIFNKVNLSILAISDHKIVHTKDDDKIKYWKLDNCTLITSSAWRNSQGAAVGGIGILLSKQAEKSISEVTSVNQRILVVTFNGNPATTVIANYAPVEGSEDSEAHYQKLTETANGIPKHRLLIEVGDFNAHLGNADVPYTYHQSTNSNGTYLLEHTSECNLIITNTQRRKKKGKLWTYISDMNGRKTQIDYILVNRKWKNSIHNVEAYSSFCSLGGDHRLVSATVRLSLRKSKSPPKKVQYDWKTLQDPEIQKQYTVEVRNRFAGLCTEEGDATEKYEKLIQANSETAEMIIPKRAKMKTTQTSKHPKIEDARKEAQEAFRNYQKQLDTVSEDKWKRSKLKVQTMYREIEEEELDSLIQEVEQADDKSKHGESWKLINKISGRKIGRQGILKGKTKEDRLKSWHKHFQTLLGKDPVRARDEDVYLVQIWQV